MKLIPSFVLRPLPCIHSYKWPKYFVFCPAIIKNPTGKVLRKDLHSIPGKRHVAPRPSSKSLLSSKL